eukprot:NODE_673_length_5339_cov_0.242366.p3 type:complete len:135 gc:universal NODE_673_length_5339_cov_0.242366:2004-2408(+)
MMQNKHNYIYSLYSYFLRKTPTSSSLSLPVFFDLDRGEGSSLDLLELLPDRVDLLSGLLDLDRADRLEATRAELLLLEPDLLFSSDLLRGDDSSFLRCLLFLRSSDLEPELELLNSSSRAFFLRNAGDSPCFSL